MSFDVYDRLIWLNGQILKSVDAKINILSPTSQYGLNVFEGIRCYWNEEQKQLFGFRIKKHFKRLIRSQILLHLELKYSIEDMEIAFFEVIKANNYKEDISVRQTIFADGYGSWSSKTPVGMFVAPVAKNKLSAEYIKEGLHCCVSSWQRINDNSISPRIKCGANYINSRMGQLEALRNGYDTTIFMNDCGKVSEGPGSCLFIIRDGVLITPPVTDSVLESITRDSVIKIAKDLMNIPVIERSIDRTELYISDEAFLCGSAMEITPVLSIDRYLLGNGQAGGFTLKIKNLYLDIVRGIKIYNQKWLTSIY